MSEPRAPAVDARLHIGLMVALTFSTGVVDVTCYLGLNQVFTANMTGNILLLGMGLVVADLRAIGPLVALIAFVGGATAAGWGMRGVARGWTPRATVLLAVSAVLVAAAAVPLLPGSSSLADATTGPILVATALLGVSMGLQAGVARHISVAEVNTLVVTWTLVGLAYESTVGQAGAKRWPRRVLAILSLLAGAVLGAALLEIDILWSVLFSAGLVAAVAAVGALTHRHRADE